MDGGVDPVAVFGMDLLEPPFAGGAHRIWRMAVAHLERLVPQHMVAGEMPVPDRIIGGARGKAIALLDLAQRVLGPLAVGDVEGDARKTRRRSRRIAQAATPGDHPADLAVEVADPVFGMEFVFAVHRRPDARADRLAIGGMDAGEIFLERQAGGGPGWEGRQKSPESCALARTIWRGTSQSQVPMPPAASSAKRNCSSACAS